MPLHLYFVLVTCVKTMLISMLIQEAEELTYNDYKSLENVREEVKCFKKMYKIGKTEKIQDYFLYYKILKRAYNTASYGYLFFQATDLKKEAEDLMKAMKKCGENLGIHATLDMDDGNTWNGWTFSNYLWQCYLLLVPLIALYFRFL